MKRYGYLLLLMFLSLMISTQANASTFLTVPENDWLVKNIMTPLFDSDSSPFSAVSKVFLGGVLAFGGLLATYTMVVGTMSTAHDGQALGKKWSSVWVPIRTSLGVALIVPIKNGFCGIQLIIVWLALQGIALADNAWDEFSKNPLAGAEYNSPAITPALKPLYIKAMLSGACQYAFQDYANTLKTKGATESAAASLSNNVSISSLDNVGMTMTGGSYSQGVVYNFGFPATSGIQVISPESICGTFTTPGGSSSSSTSSGSTDTSEPEVVAGLLNLDELKEQIFNAQVPAMRDFLKSASDLGYQLAGDSSISIDSVYSKMNSAINTYINTVQSTASSSFSSVMSDDGVADMQKDGFVSAGSWFYRIVRVQQAVTEQFSTVPTSGFMDSNIRASNISDKIIAVTQKIQEIGEKASDKNMSLSEKGGGVEGMLNTFINASFTGNEFSKMTENPLYAATNMGLHLMAGAGLGLAAVIAMAIDAGLAGGNIISSAFGGSTVAVILATFLAPVLAAALSSLLMPGVYLSIYLPMIPFIIWTGTVIGWLVLVVEALFAGPLWAMSHMTPDSDGFVGRQGQGYLLIMSLILRPVLMVIGFVAALSMLKPAALFVNYFFAFTVSASDSGGVIGFVQRVGSMILYCVILNNIVKKVLSMIHALPDSILQWIGGTSPTLGQYGSGVESGTGNSFQSGIINGVVAGKINENATRQAQQSSERLKRVTAAKKFGQTWSEQPRFNGLTREERESVKKQASQDMMSDRFGIYQAYQQTRKGSIDFSRGAFQDYAKANK